MSLISQTMTATKKHKASLLNFLCLFLAFSCLFVVQAAAQEKSVIIVNERALVGPNSAAQLRGGRLFLPVATIAQALGDTLSSLVPLVQVPPRGLWRLTWQARNTTIPR